MMESHPCPQCGEYLEIPRELSAQPVRCGACQRIFTPRESGIPTMEPEPRGRRRRMRDLDERETPKSSTRPVLIILGLLGVFSLICCGAVGWLVFQMMNPKWQVHDNAEFGFQVKFPTGPVRAKRLPTGRGAEVAKGMMADRPMIQEEYSVVVVPLGKDDRKPEKVLAELAKGLQQQWPAATEVHAPVPTSHGGHDAMDLCWQHANDRFTQIRIVIANNKAYILDVSGPGDPEGKFWTQEFFDSFTPTDGK